MASLFHRLTYAWNAFMNKDPTRGSRGPTVYDNDSRFYRAFGSDKSLVTSVYERISIDSAACDIRHVTVDESDRFIDTIDSKLNRCLTSNANIDQTSRAFVKDAIFTMLDNGRFPRVFTW